MKSSTIMGVKPLNWVAWLKLRAADFAKWFNGELPWGPEVDKFDD